MSEERRALLLAYGADARAHARHEGHARRDRAAPRSCCAEHPDWFMPQQFRNPANPEVHRRTTGAEILRAVPERRRLRRRRRHRRHHHRRRRGAARPSGHGVWIVAVEPAASPVLSGGEPGFHDIQGIGAGFVPENLEHAASTTRCSRSPTRRPRSTPARSRATRACWSASPSGANCAAAIAVARQLGRAGRRPDRSSATPASATSPPISSSAEGI